MNSKDTRNSSKLLVEVFLIFLAVYEYFIFRFITTLFLIKDFCLHLVFIQKRNDLNENQQNLHRMRKGFLNIGQLQ